MPYRRIKITKTLGRREKKILVHADAMLADVYTMLGKHPLGRTKAGACNFSAVLVLVCLLDALSAFIYHPSRSMRRRRGVQFKRIEKLIHNLLPWNVLWTEPDKHAFAQIIYYEFRNPLAHEAGRDPKQRIKARPRGYQESVVTLWGGVKPHKIGNVDGWKKWPDVWPILEPHRAVVRSGTGKPFRYQLNVVALYWAVKNVVRQLSK